MIRMIPGLIFKHEFYANRFCQLTVTLRNYFALRLDSLRLEWKDGAEQGEGRSMIEEKIGTYLTDSSLVQLLVPEKQEKNARTYIQVIGLPPDPLSIKLPCL
jgi:hypothetical protein